ncbi:putative RNase H-like nuclease (RuvC/YqgF family) [Bradyrhizobium diazoefficiens]
MADAKSGSALGAENAETLKNYLEALEREGRPLPTRGGEVNRSAIALACEFNRQVLYTNPAAVKLLAAAIEKLPTAATGEDEDPKPEAKSDRRDRRILSLEQQLAASRAECAGLREKLRRLEQIEDIMVATGRRVS